MSNFAGDPAMPWEKPEGTYRDGRWRDAHPIPTSAAMVVCEETGASAVRGACPVHRGDACLYHAGHLLTYWMERASAAPSRGRWERAYRRSQREWEVLPRSGLHGKRPALLRAWVKTDALPAWVAACVEPILAFLVCTTYNHTPMTDMDDSTICCTVCRRTLGKHK